MPRCRSERAWSRETSDCRSEEHTSELQSRLHLVCRLLLEKKKTQIEIETAEDPGWSVDRVPIYADTNPRRRLHGTSVNAPLVAAYDCRPPTTGGVAADWHT